MSTTGEDVEIWETLPWCGLTHRAEAYRRPQFLVRECNAPVCAHPSPQVLGAQLDESLRVRCSVTANPPDVNFFWQFNNSGESLEVSPLKFGNY
ncbi:hypothetical protein HF086_003454 [Spodoptera exigua]|uniref:Ig-like domain-containing protein n=1 Tax=Spodoptera exigua TaxID=7107 RepID=A0A922MHK9_SPOEX|nr:hypothetical protein HF086_003454 [Spodoptera exigua]